MMTAKEYVEGKVKSYTRLAADTPQKKKSLPVIPARTDHKVTGFQTSITTKISQTGGFYNG